MIALVFVAGIFFWPLIVLISLLYAWIENEIKGVKANSWAKQEYKRMMESDGQDIDQD